MSTITASPRLDPAVLALKSTTALDQVLPSIPKDTQFAYSDQIWSSLSPAAYLAHIYHEMALKIGADTGDEAFLLKNRRPDLANLRLDDKNLHEEIPTLTLANELLLAAIQQKKPGVSEEDILDDFRGQTYPLDVPFDLAFERFHFAFKAISEDTFVRFSYLTNKKYPNHYKIDGTASTNEILKASKEERDIYQVRSLIFDGEDTDSTRTLASLFGSNTKDLGSTSNMCEALDVDMKTLRDILCDGKWLSEGDANLTNNQNFDIGQAYSGKTEVKFNESNNDYWIYIGDAAVSSESENLGRWSSDLLVINKYARLKRLSNFSGPEIDWLIQAASHKVPTAGANITIDFWAILNGLPLIAYAREWCDRFDIDVDTFVGMVRRLNPFYRDGSTAPSQYRKLFGKKAGEVANLVRSTKPLFADLTLAERRTIASGVGVSTTELAAIIREMEAEGELTNFDEAALSAVFRIAKFFDLMGWGVSEGLELVRVLDAHKPQDVHAIMPLIAGDGHRQYPHKPSKFMYAVMQSFYRLMWLADTMKENGWGVAQITTIAREVPPEGLRVQNAWVQWVDALHRSMQESRLRTRSLKPVAGYLNPYVDIDNPDRVKHFLNSVFYVLAGKGQGGPDGQLPAEARVIDLYGLVLDLTEQEIEERCAKASVDLVIDTAVNADDRPALAADLTRIVLDVQAAQHAAFVAEFGRFSSRFESPEGVLAWIGAEPQETLATLLQHDYPLATPLLDQDPWPGGVEIAFDDLQGNAAALALLFQFDRHATALELIELDEASQDFIGAHPERIDPDLPARLTLSQFFVLSRYRGLQAGSASASDWTYFLVAGYESATTEDQRNDGVEHLAALLHWPSDEVKTICADLNSRELLATMIPQTIAEVDLVSRHLLAMQRLGVDFPALSAILTAGQSAYLAGGYDWSDMMSGAEAAEDAARKPIDFSTVGYEPLSGQTAPAASDPYDNQNLVTRMRGATAERLRDALIAGFFKSVVNPNAFLTATLKTKEDLFRFLLLDVNVSREVPTTRLLEAINSVQLYVYRALHGQEPLAIPDREDFISKWTVSDRYRVWEANERLRIHAENYVDPSLRIGKSPEFEEFESALGASPADRDELKVALRTYMQKIQKLSNMRIIGFEIAYRMDSDDGELVLIGHPESEPKKLFVRKIGVVRDGEDAVKVADWSIWRRIDLPLGDNARVKTNVCPVYHMGVIHYVWCELSGAGDKTKLFVNYVMENEDGGIDSVARIELAPSADPSQGDDATFNCVLSPARRLTSTYNNEAHIVPLEVEETVNGTATVTGFLIHFQGTQFVRVEKQDSGDSIDFGASPEGHTRLAKTLHEPLKSGGAKTLVARTSETLGGHEVWLEHNPGLTWDFDFLFSGASLNNRDLTLTFNIPPEMTFRLRSNSPMNAGEFFIKFSLKRLEDDYTIDEECHIRFDMKDLNGVYSIDFEANNSTHQSDNVDNIEYLEDMNVATKTFFDVGPGKFYLEIKFMIACYFPPTGRQVFWADPEFIETGTVPIINTMNREFAADVYVPDAGGPTYLYLGDVKWHPDEDFQGTLYQLNTPIWNDVGSPNKGSLLKLYRSNFQYKREYPYSNFRENYRTSVEQENTPNRRVIAKAAIPEIVDFEGPMSPYYWEVFYYLPIRAARACTDAGEFEEAKEWMRLIYDKGAEQPWSFRPFIEEFAPESFDADLSNVDPEAIADVDVVARAEPYRYMVATVRQKLENLCKQGDSFYAQETVEALSPAKMWYVDAAEEFRDDFNELLNAYVKMGWSYPTLGALADTAGAVDWSLFATPINEELMADYALLRSRLENIRHWRDMNGNPLDIPLIEDPIDPQALQKIKYDAQPKYALSTEASEEEVDQAPSLEVAQAFVNMASAARYFVISAVSTHTTAADTAYALKEKRFGLAMDLATANVTLSKNVVDTITAEKKQKTLIQKRELLKKKRQIIDAKLKISSQKAAINKYVKTLYNDNKFDAKSYYKDKEGRGQLDVIDLDKAFEGQGLEALHSGYKNAGSVERNALAFGEDVLRLTDQLINKSEGMITEIKSQCTRDAKSVESSISFNEQQLTKISQKGDTITQKLLQQRIMFKSHTALEGAMDTGPNVAVGTGGMRLGSISDGAGDMSEEQIEKLEKDLEAIESGLDAIDSDFDAISGWVDLTKEEVEGQFEIFEGLMNRLKSYADISSTSISIGKNSGNLARVDNYKYGLKYQKVEEDASLPIAYQHLVLGQTFVNRAIDALNTVEGIDTSDLTPLRLSSSEDMISVTDVARFTGKLLQITEIIETAALNGGLELRQSVTVSLSDLDPSIVTTLKDFGVASFSLTNDLLLQHVPDAVNIHIGGVEVALKGLETHTGTPIMARLTQLNHNIEKVTRAGDRKVYTVDKQRSMPITGASASSRTVNAKDGTPNDRFRGRALAGDWSISVPAAVKALREKSATVPHSAALTAITDVEITFECAYQIREALDLS